MGTALTAYLRAFLVCLTLLHTATSDATDSDQIITIRGLFDILSSSSQGQASIATDAEQSSEERTQFDEDLDSNYSSHPFLSTTVPYVEEMESSDLALPEPQRLVPIIRTKLHGERELEKSHSDAKEIRIEQIKASLLSKLQLQQLPNPRLVDLYTRFPQHILEDIVGDRMQMDEPEQEDNYHAKIDQMIRFTQPVPQEKSARIPSENLNSTLYFPMPFSVTEESLHTATLLVYVETPAGYEGEQVTLNVLSNPWSKSVWSRKVVLSHGGHWEHIDITEQCKTWMKHEWKNNLGLSVEAEIRGINLISNDILSSSNHSLSRLPLVKLKLNEKEYNRRNKRSLYSDMPLSCSPEDNEKRCCRYPFVLDFDELGPDFKFIISPKRYWANYCKGMCPEYLLPANPHIQLTRGVNKAQRCCTPSGVDSLTLIYLNDNGDIMRGVIPGMSITSCGCD